MSAADWDGDGHVDLLVGQRNDFGLCGLSGTNSCDDGIGKIYYYEHRVGSDAGCQPSDEVSPDSELGKAFANASGHPELEIVAAPNASCSSIKELTGSEHPLSNIEVFFDYKDGEASSHGVAPEVADWDGDSDLDLLVADPNSNSIKYFERKGVNNGSTSFCYDLKATYQPYDMPDQVGTKEESVTACQKRCASVPGCKTFSFWTKRYTLTNCHLQDSSASLEFDEDAVAGPPACADGSLVERVGSENPFDGISNNCGSILESLRRSKCQSLGLKVVDWDKDGDMDLIVGGVDGNVRFFERVADGTIVERTESDNPFRDVSVHHNARPEAVDWDGDEDIDLIVGDDDGKVHFYERTGSKEIVKRTGEANPFDSIAGYWTWGGAWMGGAAPRAVDWNGDGKLDILVLDNLNIVRWYKDIGEGHFVLVNTAMNLGLSQVLCFLIASLFSLRVFC